MPWLENTAQKHCSWDSTQSQLHLTLTAPIFALTHLALGVQVYIVSKQTNISRIFTGTSSHQTGNVVNFILQTHIQSSECNQWSCFFSSLSPHQGSPQLTYHTPIFLRPQLTWKSVCYSTLFRSLCVWTLFQGPGLQYLLQTQEAPPTLWLLFPYWGSIPLPTPRLWCHSDFSHTPENPTDSIIIVLFVVVSGFLY